MEEYDNLVEGLLVNKYNAYNLFKELHNNFEFEYDLKELFSEVEKSLEDNTKILDNGIPMNWENELN